jgi:sugar phosphate isomerase/epimerase
MGYLTLGWLTLLDLPPLDVIAAAPAGGFNSVSIRVTGRAVNEPFHDIVGNKAAIAEMRKRLDGDGVRMSNLSTYHLTPDVTLEHLKPVLDTAVQLKSEIMVVTCADPDEQRWTDFVTAYADLAATYNQQMAFECVAFSQCNNLDKGYRIIKNVNRPNFGMLVDPLHVARSGGSAAQLAKMESNRFIFAQLCDARREKPANMDLRTEARTGRLYPGKGELPLYDILDAMPRDIEIELEMPHPDHASMTPAEVSRRVGDVARAYLDTYWRQRPASARA